MKDAVTLAQACDYFCVDLELALDFADYGLYPTVLVEGEPGIEARHMSRLRQVLSLYKALGINKEGIEAVLELRERVSGLEVEIGRLRGELRRLERVASEEGPEELARLGLLVEVDAIELSARAWPARRGR